MSPTGHCVWRYSQPHRPIPILYRGFGETALRSVARHNGYLGDRIRTYSAIAAADRLQELRIGKGVSLDDFTVLTGLTDAGSITSYWCAEDADITGILTMLRMFYVESATTLVNKSKDLTLDS